MDNSKGSHGDGGPGEQKRLKYASAKDKDYQVKLERNYRTFTHNVAAMQTRGKDED